MNHPILRELLDKRTVAAVCWMGNLGWLIAGAGRLIAFDLDLDSPERLGPPPVSARDIASCLEILFITHKHSDHFNKITGSFLARESACFFVVPANCVDRAREIGVSAERIHIARPREPFDLRGIHVEPLRAIHGHVNQTVHSGANLDDCGYVFDIGGVKFFQPGDTLLSEDHLALVGIDVLFVSPTEHNMHIQPAAALIHALRPRYVFPQHFDTYLQSKENAFWTRGFPDELAQALEPQLRSRYKKLRQGDVFVIESHLP